jgi:hypothetical protein
MLCCAVLCCAPRLLLGGDRSAWDRALLMPHYTAAGMPLLSSRQVSQASLQSAHTHSRAHARMYMHAHIHDTHVSKTMPARQTGRRAGRACQPGRRAGRACQPGRRAGRQAGNITDTQSSIQQAAAVTCGGVHQQATWPQPPVALLGKTVSQHEEPGQWWRYS